MQADEVRAWREADRLFAHWLDLPAAERERWRSALALPPEVDTLLARLIAQQPAGDAGLPPLDAAASLRGLQAEVPNRLAGRRVGRWELIDELGRGGMSVVYRARRLDVDFEQIAAVKLLSLATLGSEGSARFEQERRLLARLHHPQIAALIDGGIADDGTPFLAMSLIEGKTLAAHCAGLAADWRLRVALLRAVCDAVAHAHRNLLVHRDLKPSNIVVTAEGVPILLDFGIAKLLDDEQPHTRTGMRALTPGYAAPEQVAGAAITTATDVYSLGVVLKELCAGLARLPSDLRNIIAMATRVEPERRYPDARALAEDLDRLLQQRPVRATPDSLAYRLRALLRRRRGTLAASLLIALSLLVGLGLTLWQAQRASIEAQEARYQAARAVAARDFLFAMIRAGDRELNENADLPLSSVIAHGVATLEDSPPSDPQLHAEMALLLGNLDTTAGQYERAQRMFERAEAQLGRLDSPALEVDLLLRRGVLDNALGDAPRALVSLDAALTRLDQLTAEARASLLPAVLAGWATAMNNTGQRDAARARLLDELNRPAARNDVASRADLLLTLASVSSEPLQRLEALSEAQAIYATIDTSPAQRLLLTTELGSANMQLRRPEVALLQLQEAAALAERIHPGTTSRRARAYANLAVSASQAYALVEAEQAFAVAEGIYQALGDGDSPAFAALLHNRGTLLRDTGYGEAAVMRIEPALAAARRHFGQHDPRSLVALRNLAFARAEASADPQADAEWREAHDHLPASSSPRERYDLLLIGAHIALLLGDGEALAARLDAADQLAETNPQAVALSAVQRLRQATLTAAKNSLRGDYAAADAVFATTEAQAAESGRETWSARWRNHLAWSEHLVRSQRPAEAARQREQARRLLEQVDLPHPSALRQRLR